MNQIETFIEKEQFFHLYQPIFNLKTGMKIGYEGLLRSEVYKNPEIPFRLARQSNKLYQLDTNSMYKALLSYFDSPKNGDDMELLFINVLPSTLINPEFHSFIEKIKNEARIPNQKVVFELNEVEEIPYSNSFSKNISEIKKEGFIVAVDDVGIGYSSLKTIIELQPEYVKMDRYFAKDLTLSAVKQELIKLIVTFCDNIGARLVLEGVEQERDLEMAKFLGVTFCQGFLLGKPGPLNNEDTGYLTMSNMVYST